MKSQHRVHHSILTIAVAIALTAPIAVRAGTTCSVTSNADWCFEQGMFAGSGGAEQNDQLGYAVAAGDFNDDGFLDLAVGAPGENGGVADGDGAVHVLYGDGVFPRAVGATLIVQTAANSRFGAAMVADDFNGDGIDDLLIGSPGYNNSGTALDCGLDLTCTDAGRVQVYAGGASGLSGSSSVQLLGVNCESDVNGDNRQFGSSVAIASRFDVEPRLFVGAPGDGDAVLRSDGVMCSFAYRRQGGSTFDPIRTFLHTGPSDERARYGDRVVGGRFSGSARLDSAFAGPVADESTASDTGRVMITAGDASAGSFAFLQTDWGGGNAADDHFGTGLAVGDFNHDGRDDLVIGAPDKAAGTGNPSNSGRIYVATGDAAATLIAGSIFNQGNLGANTAEVDDFFGAALASASVDLDAFDDLIVGVPGEEAGALDTDTGFVAILRGSASGLTSAGFDQFRQSDIGGSNDEFDQFGSVLGKGDFNNDGVDEIIIGVPRRSVGGQPSAGRVYIARQFSAPSNGTDLSVAFSGTIATITRGSALSDTISARNNGALARATGITVHVTYPSGTTFGTPTHSGGNWNCVVNVAGTFDCTNTQELAINQSTNLLTLNVVVPANFQGISFVRTATVDGPLSDPNGANNSITLTAPIDDTIFRNGFQ